MDILFQIFLNKKDAVSWTIVVQHFLNFQA